MLHMAMKLHSQQVNNIINTLIIVVYYSPRKSAPGAFSCQISFGVIQILNDFSIISTWVVSNISEKDIIINPSKNEYQERKFLNRKYN